MVSYYYHYYYYYPLGSIKISHDPIAGLRDLTAFQACH